MKIIDRTEIVVFSCGAGVIATVLASMLLWGWYKAGVQASVYERQGIQLSQWECFVGAEPSERVIQMKDKANAE